MKRDPCIPSESVERASVELDGPFEPNAVPDDNGTIAVSRRDATGFSGYVPIVLPTHRPVVALKCFGFPSGGFHTMRSSSVGTGDVQFFLVNGTLSPQMGIGDPASFNVQGVTPSSIKNDVTLSDTYASDSGPAFANLQLSVLIPRSARRHMVHPTVTELIPDWLGGVGSMYVVHKQLDYVLLDQFGDDLVEDGITIRETIKVVINTSDIPSEGFELNALKKRATKRGIFSDSIWVSSPTPFKPFVIRADQEVTADGEVIMRNRIFVTERSVDIVPQ